MNAELDAILREAEALRLARTGAVTLAALAADFDRRTAAVGTPPGATVPATMHL